MDAERGYHPSASSSNAADAVSTDARQFLCGDTVVAVRDLRVRGTVVVREGGDGVIVGPANSTGRICVQFENREDHSENRLNCLPDELRHTLAGGYQIGVQVKSARPIHARNGTFIPTGTSGTVLGPARQQLNGPHSQPSLAKLSVLFSLNGTEAKEVSCELDDVETAIAGNFRRGNAVIATRDLRVGGVVVVREGVLGTVVGPSSSDSLHRVTISFSHREDGSRNRLNCVINEIRLYLAGGFEVGARVHVVRPVTDGQPQLAIGSVGTVVGPASEDPLARLVVRLDNRLPNGGSIEREVRSDDVALMIAGGFRRGESVVAAKDLRVKSLVVVKQGVVGTVVGQSATDPSGRVTVTFARREDGRCNNLNVVPAEIQRLPSTGGLMPGDRVAAQRQLLVVPKGTHGTVIGPSGARSLLDLRTLTRVAVRFNTVEDGEEVVLHVEPDDLRVLHAVGEDVDDTGLDQHEREDNTEEGSRQSAAGGYDRGDTVVSTRDLYVHGNIVVRANVIGTVIGPSSLDPSARITVAFCSREDGKTNNLNVVTSEIRRLEPSIVARGELCAICLGELVSEGEDICRMPCGHVLHAACVRAYLYHQAHLGGRASCAATATTMPLKPAQCPVCRRDVLP